MATDPNPLKTLSSLIGALASPFASLKTEVAKTIDPLQKLTVLMTQLSSVIADLLANKTTNAPASGGGGGGAAAGGGAEVVEGGGGVASAVLGSLGALVGALAAGVAAIVGFIGAVQPFVQALSPVTIDLFNRALRDLSATIGVAFQPIFQILTGTIKEVAGIILPVMQALRPVVEQLTRVFAGELIAIVRILADTLTGLFPVITFLADLLKITNQVLAPFISLIGLAVEVLVFPLSLLAAVLQPLIDMMRVVTAIFSGFNDVLQIITIIFNAFAKTILDSIKAFTSTIVLKPIIDSVVAVFKTLITYMLLFIVTIAKFLGADKFLDNLKQGLKAPGPGQKAAGTATFKSLEQVSKDLAVASFSATPAGTGDEKKADLGDLIKVVEDAQKSDGLTLDKLIKAVTDILDFLKDPTGGLRQKAGEAANQAKEAGIAYTNGVSGYLGFGEQNSLSDNSFARGSRAVLNFGASFNK